MFENIKATIKEVSITAVKAAEEALGSNKGKQKKAMAINYIVSKIPVASPFQRLVAMLLSSFIDDAVELAVQLMTEGGLDGRDE